MKKLLSLIVIIALVFGGWYLVSPWLAMKGMADAAQEGDLAALEERIDFESIRASATQQLADEVQSRDGRGGLVDLVGSAIVERVGREFVDSAVTPENIGALVATGALAAPFIPDRLRGQEISWDVEREGLDAFRAVGTFEDGTSGPTLLFTRDGVGWKMSGFDLSEFGE